MTACSNVVYRVLGGKKKSTQSQNQSIFLDKIAPVENVPNTDKTLTNKKLPVHKMCDVLADCKRRFN